jgi:tetratricopeptide (TPR) repeat protein
VYFATQGNHVVIGTSESVIARSLGAVKSGDSILKDPAFAKTISRIGPSSTLAAFAHASRCAELARPYMSAGEAAEMDQFVGTMKETVGSLVISQSDQVLGVSLHVTGLPKIGGVVAKLIQQERRGGEQRRLAARAEQAQDWDQFYELAQNDAMPLNNAAWSLLTDRRPDARQIELALRFAERANELTGHSNWMFVDTLALAHFENGDVQKAITLERKAVELAGSDPRRKEAEAALARFEAALAKATTGGTE